MDIKRRKELLDTRRQQLYILLPKILPERGQKRVKGHEHPHHRGGGQ